MLPVFLNQVSFGNTRLLRAAVESVIEQAYGGPLEILIVDDGSPKPVESLASELGPAVRAVRWLRLGKNQGIVGALNFGIAAARYPLIARIDADDRWLTGKLQAQIEQFSEDPDLTISATGMVRVDAEDVHIDTHIRPGDWAGILRFFVEGGCPFPHGSVVADRRVYRILGGYPWSAAIRHCEDYALWGTWLRFFKPSMLERALYAYRVSKRSVSSIHADQQSVASRMVRDRFAMLELSSLLPRMLPALSEALGSSLFEGGLLAYTAWHFRAPMALPEVALGPLASILPDRVLTRVSEARPWREVLGLSGSSGERLIAIRADSIGMQIPAL